MVELPSKEKTLLDRDRIKVTTRRKNRNDAPKG